MKKQTEKKWKKWAIYFLIFMAGWIVSPKHPITKEIVREVPKEVIKEVCHSEKLWRSLKAIDDQGFSLAGDGFGISADITKAIGRFDLDSAEVHIKRLDAKTDQMQKVAMKRAKILLQLGY